MLTHGTDAIDLLFPLDTRVLTQRIHATNVTRRCVLFPERQPPVRRGVVPTEMGPLHDSRPVPTLPNVRRVWCV